MLKATPDLQTLYRLNRFVITIPHKYDLPDMSKDEQSDALRMDFHEKNTKDGSIKLYDDNHYHYAPSKKLNGKDYTYADGNFRVTDRTQDKHIYEYGVKGHLKKKINLDQNGGLKSLEISILYSFYNKVHVHIIGTFPNKKSCVQNAKWKMITDVYYVDGNGARQPDPGYMPVPEILEGVKIKNFESETRRRLLNELTEEFSSNF
jgi:hypothetical protein